MIGYGEYVLSRDPYNFDTEEDFIKFHYPELLDDKEFKDENTVKKDVYKR